MAQPRILLVETDLMRAQQLSRAIEARLFVRPSRVTSAEAALLWLGENPCDVCLLAYRLPGMDGLEGLVRIHQRSPELPIVMLSSAGSEPVAIAAFRAGVKDYLPTSPGYAEIAARRIDEIIQGKPASVTAAAARIPPDVPAHLLEPSYQNRLRTIGHQLDRLGYRFPNIAEVDGGFLVVALPQAARAREALEFSDRDFPFLVASAIVSRAPRPAPQRPMGPVLLPTGYQDFLRALGWRLDARQVEAITVFEMDDRLAVAGRHHQTGATTGQFRRFHEFYGPEEIASLLDEAFQQRSQRGPKTPPNA